MAATDKRIVDSLREAAIDCDVDNISPDLSFRENGIDSLDVMSLLLAIEEKHGVKFSTEEAEAITTPAELTAALDRKLS